MLWQTLRPGCFTVGEFSGYKPCITQYWIFIDQIVVAQTVEICFQDYDSGFYPISYISILDFFIPFL